MTALIGKSGAGKSTFLNYLSGRFNSSSIETVTEDINVLVGRNSSFLQQTNTKKNTAEIKQNKTGGTLVEDEEPLATDHTKPDKLNSSGNSR